MDIKYFQDSDTLLVNFSDRKIVETRDVNENVLIEQLRRRKDCQRNC